MNWNIISHNFCWKYPPFSWTPVFCYLHDCHCLMTESWHSVAVTLSHISDELLHLVYEWAVVHCLKFQRTHNTTTSAHQQVLAKKVSWANTVDFIFTTLTSWCPKMLFICCCALNFHFYPRNAMLARVIEIASCLSVCPSRAGIVSKRRKLAAWFLHHLVAPRL